MVDSYQVLLSVFVLYIDMLCIYGCLNLRFLCALVLCIMTHVLVLAYGHVGFVTSC